MIRVEIQARNGKVTICVGGPAPTKSGDGKVLDEGNVQNNAVAGNLGGDAANEEPGMGGGGPGCGCLVIGPIVAGGAVSQVRQDDSSGGDAANEDPSMGGGGPGGGCVVIGPIVLSVRGTGSAAAQTTSKAVDVSPS